MTRQMGAVARIASSHRAKRMHVHLPKVTARALRWDAVQPVTGAFCNGHVLLCDGEEHEFAGSGLYLANLVVD
ncbi:hypothetical protein DWV92_07630 [Bifidobacterium pseudolongum]|uniref:Uncharacterized protein n=1 Tax=Bifidobacterium pseudolongum TaxID=1694 RepID=A0A395XCF9_9BIFI|nr:hypothetical protein DWV92_07630 [Bifidobacterium pseudolongum]